MYFVKGVPLAMVHQLSMIPIHLGPPTRKKSRVLVSNRFVGRLAPAYYPEERVAFGDEGADCEGRGFCCFLWREGYTVIYLNLNFQYH